MSLPGVNSERQEDPMSESDPLIEIIRSTRAMRRLKPDPVPDELVRKILEAGVCAASGGNNQRWRFMVVKDRSIKEQVQKWYRKAFDEVVGPRYRNSEPPPGSSPGRYRRAARRRPIPDRALPRGPHLDCRLPGRRRSHALPFLRRVHLPRRPEHAAHGPRSRVGRDTDHPPSASREGS